MTRETRAGPRPMQGELALFAPVPAQGTVIVMLLEDLLSLGGDHAARAFAGVVGNQTAPPCASRTLEQQVLDWLRGAGPSDTYLADTRRESDGRVTATTAEAIVRGGGGLHDVSADEGSRRRAVSKVLTRLGWTKRYPYNAERVRQRRFFAPPGLKA